MSSAPSISLECVYWSASTGSLASSLIQPPIESATSSHSSDCCIGLSDCTHSVCVCVCAHIFYKLQCPCHSMHSSAQGCGNRFSPFPSVYDKLPKLAWDARAAQYPMRRSLHLYLSYSTLCVFLFKSISPSLLY